MLHLEFFVTPTAKRSLVQRRMMAVYSIAGVVTKKRGGSGPWAYLLEPKQGRGTSPSIRASFNVRADEDLWAEVAFYPNRSNLRGTIHKIWRRPDFQRVIVKAESLNSGRKRTSSVDLGRLKAS